MTKITLDLPAGLHRVLAIDALIKGVTVEEVTTEYLHDQVRSHLELPEMYAQVIGEIYGGQEFEQFSSSDTPKVKGGQRVTPGMKPIAKISGHSAEAISAALKRGSGLSYEDDGQGGLRVIEEK